MIFLIIVVEPMNKCEFNPDIYIFYHLVLLKVQCAQLGHDLLEVLKHDLSTSVASRYRGVATIMIERVFLL